MANSIQRVTKNCFRVLLDPILAEGEVTIGFSDKTVPADLSMVAPDWTPKELDGIVGLQDAVKVSEPIPTTDITDAVAVSVVKTGTKHTDFQITIHNNEGSEGLTSAALEVYIEWGGH